MIKNIIFDMGNVLLKYDTDLPLGAFCPDEEAKNFFCDVTLLRGCFAACRMQREKG